MKSFSRKLTSVALAAASIASIACAGIGSASAQTMQYHIDTTRTASLTLHKYEMEDVDLADHVATGTEEDAEWIPEDATPLADVTFTAYKIADLDDYFTPEGVELPTAEEAAEMITSEDIVTYEAVTDEDGVAKMENMELGIYYVAETDGPAQVTKPIAPFVLSLPMTTVEGDSWLYDVVSYPKNQTAYGEAIVKKVDSTTGEELPGAKFTLYSSRDNETWTEYMTDITTGEDGTATIEHIPSQTYYKFVETATSDDSYILDSTVSYNFYIDGTGDMMVDDAVVEDNTITVENDTVEIEKYILDGEKGAEGIDNTADYNETVYWKIKTSIPTNTVEKLTTYTIVDTMSTGLKYTGAELWVDDTTQLTEGTDYTVSQEGLVVTFAIVPTSLKGGSEVEVYFNTELTEEAPLATDIPNTSKLIYTNNVGTTSTFEKDSQTPTVHTGGYSFVKTDGSNPLSGAEFAIYATEEDAANGENAILTATSDENGLVEFKGLKYGAFSADEEGKAENGVENGSTQYWITETKAPDGYSLLAAPFEVTIDATSHISDNNDTVENTLTPELPITGATGTTLLFVIAAALVGAGVFGLVVRRRKNSK